MPCDGCWVNVMLTKWPKEILMTTKTHTLRHNKIHDSSFCKGDPITGLNYYSTDWKSCETKTITVIYSMVLCYGPYTEKVQGAWKWSFTHSRFLQWTMNDDEWILSCSAHIIPWEKWQAAFRHEEGWIQKFVWMWKRTEKSNANINKAVRNPSLLVW